MRKFIGDKVFYRKLFRVMIPILIQNVITNLVNLLDNIMVGRVGTEPMSGVAIVNQLFFVFNIAIFAGITGAGILTSQYYGNRDAEGIRRCMRFKLLAVAFLCACALLLFGLCDGPLIRLFIHEGEAGLDLNATFDYAKSYLRIMLLYIVPFALTSVYAGTLRETAQTVVPMLASLVAVFTNFVLNFILIFGKLGLPALGVQGAAIATVISRFLEAGIMLVWTHRNKDRNTFAVGLYRHFRIPKELVKRTLLLSIPLFFNQSLWSLGMTIQTQCFSQRGLEVVSAFNISNAANHLFICFYIAMGTAVSVIVGPLLGAGKQEQAVDENRKLIAFAVALTTVIAAIMALVSPLIPRIYNTTDVVRDLARRLLLVAAAIMPMEAFLNTTSSALRSGGKTKIMFIYDCSFMYGVAIPIAMALTHFTKMPIVPLYFAVQFSEFCKSICGFIFLKKRVWVHTLVGDSQ